MVLLMTLRLLVLLLHLLICWCSRLHLLMFPSHLVSWPKQKPGT
jgi:hypothetical protein